MPATLGIVIGFVFVIGLLIGFTFLLSRGTKFAIDKIEKKARQKDSRAANILSDGINRLQQEASITTLSHNIRTFEGLRLGEVTRHFDIITSAAINGWMTHDLRVHGWGVGVGIGRAGLGVGNIGLGGTSKVSLISSGTNRDDLMGDGFVAVFEQNNSIVVDTLRVVVPSENATREWVSKWLNEIATTSFSEFRYGKTLVLKKDGEPIPKRRCLTLETFYARLPELVNFKNEASYVSDRLLSILRMPPESRPPICVYGSPLSDHAVVGTAIRFGSEQRTFPLFPLPLIEAIPQIVDKAVEVLNSKSH